MVTKSDLRKKMRKQFNICLILVFFLIFVGCAAQKPQQIWQSLPSVQRTSMELFEIQIKPLKLDNPLFVVHGQFKGNKERIVQIQIKPLKLDNPFFVAFELTVNNKSSAHMEIDWNQSRYLHKGRENGIFVFKGIEPQAIKERTIPNEHIPAGSELTKRIAPAQTIAWKSRREYLKPGESAFYPGILPNGGNSVSLVLSQNDKEWRQTLTIKIITKEIPR